MTLSMNESETPPGRPGMSTGEFLWFSAQFALWVLTKSELLELVAAVHRNVHHRTLHLWSLEGVLHSLHCGHPPLHATGMSGTLTMN